MKYKVIIQRVRLDRIIEEVEKIVEAPVKPMLGDSYTQVCYPPIHNTVIKVEEIEE